MPIDPREYVSVARPPVQVEIDHVVVVALRRSAAARGMSVPSLVRQIVEVVASDHLVDAVLDDVRPEEPGAVP